MTCPICGSQEYPSHLHDSRGRWTCGSTARAPTHTCLYHGIVRLQARMTELQEKLDGLEEAEASRRTEVVMDNPLAHPDVRKAIAETIERMANHPPLFPGRKRR